MKAELCSAFCDDLIVTVVPAGLAVATAFVRDDGDHIHFYVIEEEDGRLRLEDDGSTLPMLEGAGVDFDTETRRRALESLLSTVRATVTDDDPTIRTAPFYRAELGRRALSFVGVMLRMNDFLMLLPERIVSAFRQDAAAAIRAELDDRTSVRELDGLGPGLSEVKPDMILGAENRPPVAIFFGSSESRVHDAIFLHQTAAYEMKSPLSVVALLEQDNSIPTALRRRASNRLTAVPVFRQDEDAAVARIIREAVGQ